MFVLVYSFVFMLLMVLKGSLYVATAINSYFISVLASDPKEEDGGVVPGMR